MRRTIAAVVLFTALCAMGYLVYELVVVKPRYEADLLRYMSCTAHREAALADWRYFQSHIDLYKTWRKHLEFAGFEKLEAIGKWKCPNYNDLTAPGMLGAVMVVLGIAATTDALAVGSGHKMHPWAKKGPPRKN